MRTVAGTKEAMQMAGTLGASVVVNHVGYIPPEPSGTDWDLLVQVLTDLGRHASESGHFSLRRPAPLAAKL